MANFAAMPAGSPIWCHLETPDVPLAVKFYSQLLGWEYRPAEPAADGMGKFYLNGKAVAGIEVRGDRAAWLVTLHTSNAAQTAQAISRAGGKVVSGPTAFDGQGVLVEALDPAGARVCFWEPRGDNGFEARHDPGTAAWFECWTTNYDAAVKFYRDVAGWAINEGPIEFGQARFALNAEYEQSNAMIAEIGGPARDPWTADIAAAGVSVWNVDFNGHGVGGIDALANRAVELGGRAPAPAWHDLDAGRTIRIVDPGGASFGLIDPEAEPQ